MGMIDLSSRMGGESNRSETGGRFKAFRKRKRNRSC